MRIAQNEHTVQIVIPVTGDTVQITLCHQRGFGQQIAAFLLLIFNPTLQNLNGACTLRQHNRQSLSNIINRREVFQLSAELIVVALFRFFNRCKVCIQFILLRESRTVDTLEHLSVGIAAPVCARCAQQLDPLPFTRPVESRCGPAHRSVKSPCL